MLPDLAEALQQRRQEGLYRFRQVLEGPQSPRVTIDGRDFLAFCSNDYLGLANHPALIEAVAAGAQRYGVGSGASHLISGHSRAHHELEEALAEFVGLPRTLLFSTGYMANMAVVTALMGREDAIFADRLNHASLNDAALLSRARFIRYPHLDLVTLEKQLKTIQARRRLIVTDAVFSMDGDRAPVAELLALCQRFDAWLLLDDAHGFGVLGEQGKGSLYDPQEVERNVPHLIYMATLGKAAGVSGAFVAAQASMIETLIQHSRTYGYTTAAAPLLAHALLTSLQLISQGVWRRERLVQLIEQLRQKLQSLPWQLLLSDTPIQPLLVGGSREAVRLDQALRERGIWVPAIRPPTVPQGMARLRISLSAAHAGEDVDQLSAALHDLAGC
ncbi:8-amino-7-oxononanoate synthase [Nitrosomonas eutropha]|uniref:8-amino-7-oxononanoate synthase n=2 Tax=Nitrosomonas eutropha TaxID=916 RepID=BIOF_NITEC|nr:8-amino-7-oxononanoate synthase [Nitrosomonas eutropha]Q0AE73.1 RecName: Full=8-amino-7-oxononanoate synthase; Short=AONS; AltName: Full=7-keto-8-amino-pelargonic acid synthase; Short=7-KAP synthase; Short=KAPA synthase; AltName: Full=8-amino-7-ketopelargonate synthase [Nitrosomonas eutropha C91]ABI60359.1 8-amino-7-oxononanoate synthase [Nitrosomonas eutropha C91]PXV83763.1 8-amino-7-oxononanoate synthase [Nitrosomonas eutropha]SCX17451.1 8-amino-7-oxononanoate synthase [Nitrosomonas eutrop